MNWYSSDIEDVKKKLGTGDYGLEQKDVEIRTFSYGENKLDDGRQQSLFMRFLLQLKDYMAIILITAAIISIIINIVEKNNNWAEPVIILAVVILNAVLGVFHENKAEEALEALKNISSPTTKVLRDGALSTVKSTAVVPGDIIVLEQGDLIPADARLLESASLRCDESPLTGESEPVEKDSDVLVAEDASPGDRINMVYSGCSVTYGKATAIVTETGMNTEIGKIAAMLSDRSGVLT
ncbi:MAG: HAD-IC family P-type ATPase, partial [Clostridia bacterium]|nr:HAD-IC family P-type ATPase [Clostridia bacterium]